MKRGADRGTREWREGELGCKRGEKATFLIYGRWCEKPNEQKFGEKWKKENEEKRPGDGMGERDEPRIESEEDEIFAGRAVCEDELLEEIKLPEKEGVGERLRAGGDELRE